jgi:hypothetical protein
MFVSVSPFALANIWNGFTPAPSFSTDTDPQAIAVGDFNGDGIQDLAVANYNSNGTIDIFVGNGDGTFTLNSSFTTGSYPNAIAVGDFNGDGKLDLAISDLSSNTLTILLGNGDGTFTQSYSHATGSYPISIAVGDFNGDGIPDLAVANFSSNTVSIFLGNGNGTFTLKSSPSTGSHPDFVVAGDFNGDGKLDLAVANESSRTLSILLGNGDGTFALKSSPSTGSVGTAPQAITVGDFNGDGKLDLAVANNYGNTVNVFLGNGDGTFALNSSLAVGTALQAIAAGDFNGDGKLDLAVTDANSNTVSILLGNGDGTFNLNSSPATGVFPARLVVGDFNGNGISDIAVTDSSSNTVSILLGQGQWGTVTELAVSPTSGPVGEQFTLSARVDTQGSATASNVTFYDGATSLGAASVSQLTTTNLLLYSEELNNPVWAGYSRGAGNTTITPQVTTAPDGSSTSLQVNLPSVPNGTMSGWAELVPVVGSVANRTFTFSMWLRSNAPVTPCMEIENQTYAYENWVPVNVTSQWQRFSATLTVGASTSDHNMRVMVTGCGSPAMTLYAWGAQMEESGAVGPYVSTLSTPEKAQGAVATLNTSSLLATGAHTLTAQYWGDSNLVASTSGIVSVNISQASSTTTIAGPGSVSYGQTYPISITASPGNGSSATPTGSVNCSDGGTNIGTTTLSGGIGTLNVPNLAVGAHSIVCTYAGDSSFTGSTSNTIAPVVTQTSSSVSLGTSGTPSTYGMAITFTASVAPSNATGTIQFKDGSSVIGTATLSSGTAVFTILTLTVGTHTITAVYSGDANYTGSTSASLTQTVNKAGSSISVVSGTNPSTYGTSVTFTATITPGATGTVTFKDGGATLGTGTLSGGSTSYTTSALAVGSHSVTAVYSGDSNFNGSTSAVLSQTVNKTASATSLSSSLNPSPYGTYVTFTVNVTAGATGTVTLMDGANTLDTLTLSSGSAIALISSLTVGTHSITAVYGGDANFNSSTSAVLTQIVNKATLTVSLSSSINPSTYDGSVSFTASVHGLNGELVTFYDGSTTLGTATLSFWSAKLTISSLTVGSHSITAVYAGDVDYNSSTSAVLTQIVNQAASTTSLASSVNPSTYGTSVTFTATVTSGATGTVTFMDGSTTLGTGTLASGATIFTTSALVAGSHSITAVYGGDSNFNGSTSGVLTQTVNKATPTIYLYSSKNPSAYGTSILLRAAVSCIGAVGESVTFKDGSTALISSSINNGGNATFTTSTLAAGSHSLTAIYGGDSNCNGATSAPLTQTVNQDASTTFLASNSNPSTYGASVIFTATVTPGATGTVTFEDGSTTIGTGSVNSGSAVFTISTLAVGSHSITAVYGGDTNYTGSTSAVLTQTVNQAASATSLVSNPNPSTYGTSVTFTANVTPGATGAVTFKDGSTTLGTGTLSNGSATFTTSTLAGGNHSITAAYGGDTNFTGSTSAVLAQTVSKTASTISLASSANPSTYGALVTFTATVTPGATGTVTFLDSGATLGTGTLSSGTTTFTTSALAGGIHSITAVYGGDSNFNGSTSAVLTQTVNHAASTTSLASSTNPSTYPTSVSFTATVTSGATGTVTFKDGGTTLGTGTLTSGTTTFTTSALAAGSHAITAVYGGDTNYNGSTSAVLTQTVNQAATTTSLASSANPSTYGESVTFTATVTPGAAMGTVTFMDGATTLGIGTLSSGTATFTTSTLAGGTHSITAVYGGGGNYAGSTSAMLSQTVSKASSTTSLSSNANPSGFGQSVTFTATVTGGSNGDTVTFYDGGASLGTGALSSGSASYTSSALALGSHSITAVYDGDANYGTSVSAVLTQNVNKSNLTISLASSSNPSTYSAPVTLTVTLTGPPNGELVTFMDGSTILGTGTLGSGSASYTTSTLAVGTHSITAVYSGDSNYNGNTSAVLTQTVNKATPTISLVSSSNPSLCGAPVTFTATMPTAATGGVVFYDGSTLLGFGTLSNGSASFATSALSSGNNSITVVYGGNSNFNGATSAVLTQTTSLTVTTLSVSSNTNPSLFGSAVTFTITVTPSAATGQVYLVDISGGDYYAGISGYLTLTNGTATVTTSTLAGGTHTLKAYFYGTPGFNAATATFSQTVNNGPTVTELAASSTTIAQGASVSLSSLIDGGSSYSEMSGTVNYFDGATSLGTAPLDQVPVTNYFPESEQWSDPEGWFGAYYDCYGQPDSITDNAAIAPNGTMTASRLYLAPPAGNTCAYASWGQDTGTTFDGPNDGVNYTFTFSVWLRADSPVPVSLYMQPEGQTGGSDPVPASEQVACNVTTEWQRCSLTTSEPLDGDNFMVPAVMVSAAPGPPRSVYVWGGQLEAADAPGPYVQNMYSPDGRTGYGGTASFDTTTLSTGSHSITAVYSGNGTFSGSTSQSITVKVLGTSSTTIASSANPSFFGQTVTFTAAVTGGSNGEAVTFFDGGTTLGTGSLSGGVATYATSALALGGHSITAGYGGDANYSGSTSAVLTQTVNQSASTTSLSSNLNPSTYGSAVTFTATVAGGGDGEIVTFKDGSSTLGTGALSSGSTSFTTSALAASSHSITGVYGGDIDHSGSTSLPLSQTINQAATTTSVSSNNDPSTHGAAVTFTATVTGGVTGETVTFRDSATTLGTGTLASGSASYTTSALAIGSHIITAIYGGDTNHGASTSAALTQTVNKPTLTVSLSSSINPSTYSEMTPFIATVTGSSNGDTVTFYDGANRYGTYTIESGVASFHESTLTAGTHYITAVYNGNSTYGLSTSNTVVQVVNVATTTVSVTSNNNPSLAGDTVGFYARVTPPGATGSVIFMDGATVLGTGTLSGGPASLGISVLAVGSHSITAVYGGDANCTGSTSAALVQNVLANSYAISASSGLNPSPFGSAVTFTATVTPPPSTGYVSFFNGTSEVAWGVPLTNGTATYTTSDWPQADAWSCCTPPLATGAYTITASYQLPDGFVAAASAPLVQTVNNGPTITEAAASSTSITVGGTVSLSSVISDSGASGMSGMATYYDGAIPLGNASLAQVPITNYFIESERWTDPDDNVGMSPQYGCAAWPAVTDAVALAPNNTMTASQIIVTDTGNDPGACDYYASWGQWDQFSQVAGLAFVFSVWLRADLPVSASLYLESDYDQSNAIAPAQVACPVSTIWQRCSVTITEPLDVPSWSNMIPSLMIHSAPDGIQVWGGQLEQASIAGPYVQNIMSSTSQSGYGSTANFSTAALTVGSHSITAVYGGSGDGIFNSSTSQSITINVATGSSVSSTTVASSANPSSYGQSVTFLAIITPSSATGSVTFMDGATPLGTGMLSNGSATYNTSALAIGSHSITAVYSGDATYAGSTSGVLTQFVDPITATISVASNNNPSTYSSSVTFTAAITGPPNGESVAFKDGAATLGTGILDSGSTQFTTSSLGVGSHSITAVYGGDSTYSSATSAPLTQTVGNSPVSINVISSENPSVFGDTITLTFTFIGPGAIPTGTATISDGAAQLATTPLDVNGQITYTTSAFVAGKHTIYVIYNGDPNYY